MVGLGQPRLASPCLSAFSAAASSLTAHSPPSPRSPTLPHILALAIMIAETESRIHLHDKKMGAHSDRKERRPIKTKEEEHAAVEPQPIS